MKSVECILPQISVTSSELQEKHFMDSSIPSLFTTMTTLLQLSALQLYSSETTDITDQHATLVMHRALTVFEVSLLVTQQPVANVITPSVPNVRIFPPSSHASRSITSLKCFPYLSEIESRISQTPCWTWKLTVSGLFQAKKGESILFPTILYYNFQPIFTPQYSTDFQKRLRSKY